MLMQLVAPRHLLNRADADAGSKPIRERGRDELGSVLAPV